MKILSFVDTHNSEIAFKKVLHLANAEKPDVIISAGDITIFGASLDFLVQQINKFHVPALFVHGNHESEGNMRDACALFKHTIFIHKKLYDLNEFLCIGFGGGGFSNKDREFEMFIQKKHEHISGKKIILVTHAPPYGTKLDQISRSYSGNKSFTMFIKKYQPELVICGHIHENRGREDCMGRTRIINPGPFGKIIDI